MGYPGFQTATTVSWGYEFPDERHLWRELLKLPSGSLGWVLLHYFQIRTFRDDLLMVPANDFSSYFTNVWATHLFCMGGFHHSCFTNFHHALPNQMFSSYTSSK